MAALTDEEREAALKAQFGVPIDIRVEEVKDKLKDNLKGSDTFGDLNLNWRPINMETGKAAPSSTQDILKATPPDQWKQVSYGEDIPEEDDYGFGIIQAFKRGVNRTGGLIDVAQGDYEELAENYQNAEQYKVSEEDQKRLEILQSKKGFWEALGYYFQNPALAAQVVAESLPMSVAPLAAGAAGGLYGSTVGPVGTAIGTATGAFAGSYATEYFNTISETFSEAKVDLKDPDQLKAAFANEELMEQARENGVQRGIPIAALDAISFGIAGRIYKPIAALGKATKGGRAGASAVGGLSEMLAQGGLGAGGEAIAQISDKGSIHDMAGVAGEFIGELVPGAAEAAVNVALDSRTPTSDTTPTTDPGDTSSTLIPETDVDAAGNVVTSTEPVAITDVDQLLKEQGKDFVEDKPAPVKKAVEPKTDAEEAAAMKVFTEGVVAEHAAAQAQVAAEAKTKTDQAGVEQTSEPTPPAPNVADVPGPEGSDTISTPMVEAKQLETAWRGFATRDSKSVPALRKAFKDLANSIRNRFPDVDLPKLPGTAGGKAIGNFFQTLDEQVDTTTELPKLKEFLTAVLEASSSADAITALQRAVSAVVAEAPTIEGAKDVPVLGQLQSAANKYDAFQKKRAAKGNKTAGRRLAKAIAKAKEQGKKIPTMEDLRVPGNLVERAQEVSELAVALKAAAKHAENLGAASQLPPTLNNLINRAISNEAKTAAPLEKVNRVKGKPVGKTKVYNFQGRTVDKIGRELRTAADEVAAIIAKAEEKLRVGAAVESVEEKQAAPKKKTLSLKKKTEPTTVTTDNLVATSTGLYAVEKPQTEKAQAKERTAESVAKDVPLNPKVAPLVSAINDAGIYTVMSGDLYGSDLVYVDVDIPLSDVSEVKLPPGWVADLPLAERTKAHFSEQLDPEQKEYLMSEGFVKQSERDIKEREKRGINTFPVEKISGRVTRLARAGGKVTKSEITRLVSALKQAQKAKKAVEKPQTEKAQAKEAVAKAETRGEKAKAVSKKKSAKKTAPEVFEPDPKVVRGKEAKHRLEKAGIGGQTLAEAYESAGISKKIADRVEGIIAAVDDSQAAAIINSLDNYANHRDGVRLLAEISEAVGGKAVGEQSAMALLNFAEGLSVTKDYRSDELSIAMEEEMARELGYDSVEDMQEITGEMGFSTIDPENEMADWEAEENLYDKPDSRAKNSPAADRVLLSRVVDKLDAWFAPTVKDNAASKGPIKDLFKAMTSKTPMKPLPFATVLEMLLSTLPTNHRFHTLAKLLERVAPDINIELVSDPIVYRHGKKSGTSPGVFRQGVFSKFIRNERKIEVHYDRNSRTDSNFIKTLMHEMVHAVTWHAYSTNDEFAAAINDLLEQTRAAVKEKVGDVSPDGVYYGLKDAHEFMAEAFTNPKFQEILAKIPSTRNTLQLAKMLGGASKTVSILESFINKVKQFVGYSTRNTVLDDVLMYTTLNFMDEAQQQVAIKGLKETEGMVNKSPAFAQPVNNNKHVDAAREQFKAADKVIAGVEEAAVKAREANLGFMSMDQMERKYRKLFAEAATRAGITFNPITLYKNAKARVATTARVFEKKSYAILKTMADMDNKARTRMQAVMRDITQAEVFPWEALNSKANEHLWSKVNKKTGKRTLLKKKGRAAAEAIVAYNKLPKASQQMIKTLANLTAEIMDLKRAAALTLLGQRFSVPANVIEQLSKVKQDADVDAVLPAPTAAEILASTKNPLDTKEQKKAKKILANELDERKAMAETAKRILVMSTIKGPYFPVRRFGDYVVSSTEDDTGKPHFSTYKTKRLARAAKKKLTDAGRDVVVTRKLESNVVPPQMATVIAELTRKVKDPDTKARMNAALIEVLAENAAYSSQLKRRNIEGAAAEDMGRGLEEYIHVSKYVLGDLITSDDVTRSLKAMKELQTQDEAFELAEVVSEIANRNREDSADRVQSVFQKSVGLLGFLNFLGAPSYWALNMTQTQVVTMPYFFSKWGALKGQRSLFKAYSTVFKAVAATLSEKDSGYEAFKARLPAEAQKVVAFLEESNVIQSTIAHEFGSMLSQSAWLKLKNNVPVVGPTVHLVYKVLEKVPEAIEHFNRISTGLAAYELSGGDMVATVDAVEATQFNYDSGNRARLLKSAPKWLGGGTRGLITPIMLFKTYGLGIMRLFYGSLVDMAFKKGGRLEAMKLAGGLIATHTAFGGMAGGIMVAPVAGMIWTFNEIFREAGDEFEPEEAVEEFLKENYNDAVATLARRGIPATVLGIDMSNSINLTNLLWMSNDRYDYSKLKDVTLSAVDNLGPMPQYVSQAVAAGVGFLQGDLPAIQAIEKIAPVKFISAAAKAIRINDEGLRTGSDLELLPPEEFDSLWRTVWGFSSTTVAEKQTKYYADEARKRRKSNRKTQLINQLNDAESVEEQIKLWEEINSFNMTLERKDQINKGDLARLRSRRRSDQRKYNRQN